MNNNYNKAWAPLPEKDNHKMYEKSYKSERFNSDFISKLSVTREEVYNLSSFSFTPANMTRTENGALVYKSSGSKLLDLNFSVSSLRGKTNTEIAEKFREAFSEQPVYAMRWLFYARDIREGLGERTLFRTCLNDLAANGASDLVNDLIPLIPEYGRWDDMLLLLNIKSCSEKVLSEISSQLREDLNTPDGKSISLLAKWLPSEQASNPEQRRYAGIIRKYLHMTPRTYRKNLSALRKRIDIVERKMSSDNWQAIDYEKVPSKANLIYKDAFLKHDTERRTAYLNALRNGEAKINSSVAFPHDIVYKYLINPASYWSSFNLPDNIDPTLEAMWKSLPNMVPEDSSTLVVADGSGSMMSTVGNTNIPALCVADALAIYFAERCMGAFKNTYITFSMTPRIVNLTGRSLLDNIKIADRYCECANTNIEAVFDLILKTAIDNHMSQDELPKNILILSDMEFDTCARTTTYKYRSMYEVPLDASLFDTLAKRYSDAGYNMPRLVFWNLCSRTNGIPMRENKFGVTLVSGFSVNTCKAIMSNKTDPYEAMIDVISNKRYDAIATAVYKHMN